MNRGLVAKRMRHIKTMIEREEDAVAQGLNKIAKLEAMYKKDQRSYYTEYVKSRRLIGKDEHSFLTDEEDQLFGMSQRII